MRKIFLDLFVVALIFNQGFLFSAEKSNLELKKYPKEKGIFIGCAVMPDQLNEPEFLFVLTNNFNYLTPENHMKWELIHPTKDGYDFSGADKIVNFALKYGMKVRGHTLVWHYQNPEWLTDADLTKEKAMELLKDHIQKVVGRYKEKVRDWDVVNEPVDEMGRLRWNIWYQYIGKNYIELALRWANEVDPDAELFLNDYSIEPLGIKSDGFYKLVKELKDKGVPLHGVGFQFHLDGLYYPNFDSIAQNIKRFKELGLEVHFTEVDVRIKGKPSERDINQHKKIYYELMKLALTYNCEAFITWGLTDKYSWIPSFFTGYGYGLMFDEDYNPKPAAYAVQEILMEEKPVAKDFDNVGQKSDERSLPVFRAVKLDKMPVIDGKIDKDEWKNLYVYPFIFNQLDTENFSPPVLQDDVYGTWRVGYKGTKIYGLVTRRDDITVTGHKNPWDNDNFELFYSIDENWKQIRTIVGKDWQKDNNVNGQAIWNKQGTILEFVVDTGVDLTGKTIGFNVALSDNDTPGNELRKCQLYPIVGNNMGWQGKGFGEMTFQDEKGNFIDGKIAGDVVPFVAISTKNPPKIDGDLKSDEWKKAVKYPLGYNRYSIEQNLPSTGKYIANFMLYTVNDSIYGVIEFIENKSVTIESIEFAFYVDGKTTLAVAKVGEDFKKTENLTAKAVWDKEKKFVEFAIKVSDKAISGKKARFSIGANGVTGDKKFALYPFCGYNLIENVEAEALGEIMSKKGIELAEIICR